MKIISNHRCIIGESPVWNAKENMLYFTNGMGNEICMLNIYTGEIIIRPVKVGVAALAFTKDNQLVVSRSDGVFVLNDDDATEELYDSSKVEIRNANDMKVGPDGRIYVGTQSDKRAGVSDEINGKLYSIDKSGNVRVLLNNLILSNGLEWSINEEKFYHTDSDTQIIKEYDFDKASGEIMFTGRKIKVPGVDGFTIDQNGFLHVACWGYRNIAVVDTLSMSVVEYIPVPAMIPASCCFAGTDMKMLMVVTASFNVNLNEDENAGFVFIKKINIGGRKPYLFG